MTGALPLLMIGSDVKLWVMRCEEGRFEVSCYSPQAQDSDLVSHSFGVELNLRRARSSRAKVKRQ